MGKTQKYLAEALGTFALVGIGSFAILSSSGTGRLDVVAIALGFGLALLVGLYAFGEVSGGHYNPAVSLGMFLDRRIAMKDMIAYWISQVVGAIAASVVVLIAFNDDAVAATTTHAADNWAAYEACEELVDLEDNFQLWRFRHLRTVQRTIGMKTGTGGSSGVTFLQKALERTFFPELFAVRTEIGQ